MVLEGWIDGKVSDVVSALEAGVSVNGEDRERAPNEKGVLKVSAVSYGTFDEYAQKVITNKTELERARTHPKAGEIIISRSNTEELVGASAFIHKDYDNLFLPDKLWQTVTRRNACAKWLSYVLASRRSRYTLSKLATGTSGSMKNITKGELLGLRILIPPLTEQLEIANILSTWDKAIDTVEKLIENSRTQKKALMQKLLNGQKRLPGFNKPWREVRFNKVFERVSRKNTIGNDNVLTISGQHGLVSQIEYFNKSVASDNLTGYTLLERGDFAYNKSYSKGYPMGAIKPLIKYDQGVVSSLYICFRLKDNKPSSQEFFRHYFEAGIFNREIYAIAQEGARNHGLLNVSVTDFFIAKLHIPEPDEKEAIEQVIRTAEQELHNLEAQLESLQNQKKSLMQQLLTGKRRVKLDQA